MTYILAKHHIVEKAKYSWIEQNDLVWEISYNMYISCRIVFASEIFNNINIPLKGIYSTYSTCFYEMDLVGSLAKTINEMCQEKLFLKVRSIIMTIFFSSIAGRFWKVPILIMLIIETYSTQVYETQKKCLRQPPL